MFSKYKISYLPYNVLSFILSGCVVQLPMGKDSLLTELRTRRGDDDDTWDSLPELCTRLSDDDDDDHDGNLVSSEGLFNNI